MVASVHRDPPEVTHHGIMPSSMVKALSLTSGILPGNLHKTSKRKRVERVVQLTAVVQPFICSKSLYSTECSSYQVSNTLAYDRFDEKSYFEEKGQGPNSQQGSLFANPLAATLQSPCLLPYTGP
ncbi:hypothetical protein DAPPUDRAFT_100927 [Daphnia pulex]|uniref:Uncharacterized protein n=1 Tax=Daphnia pulex TaxID=6669 RepID=E9GBP6_DAPPU|nr:hypothetical protein DAPPUDRAFT_100927 [Daphnia pulex]|eukprot:EFX82997.1 hypothetical protein DAPPUDRAFT_100927 [Daphnia pulex]